MMVVFVLRKPLSSLGCKFVYYIHRVAHSITMCCNCALSTCQFFTLIPGRVVWTMPRGRAPKITGPSCCICWVFSVLMNTCVPVKIIGAQDKGNGSNILRKWFRSSSPNRSTTILGLSPVPCLLASWSAPVAPWCCSCTGTAGEHSIFTPATATANAPQRPELPTPS